MKYRKYVILTGLILLLFIFSNYSNQSAKAQNIETYGKTNVWFLLLTHYKFNDNWSVGNEVHMRFDDGLRDKQQLLIRPFINYTKSKKTIYTAGYTYINTYPYSKYPLKSNQAENNIWEQITLNHQSGKFSFSHRYRLEQRFISVYDTIAKEYNYKDTKFQNRFRYRITVRYDINDKMFLNFFDELWVGSKNEVVQVAYDRNWFYAGLGYRITPKIRYKWLIYTNIYKKIHFYTNAILPFSLRQMWL
jgi:hypothetical protein